MSKSGGSSPSAAASLHGRHLGESSWGNWMADAIELRVDAQGESEAGGVLSRATPFHLTNSSRFGAARDRR